MSSEKPKKLPELMTLLDQLPLNVFVKDREGRLVLVNRSTCQTLGRSREETIGRTDFDLLPPEIAQKLRAHDDAVRRGEVIGTRDEEMVRGGETRKLLAGKVVLPDPAQGEEWLLGYSIDITELRNTERALVEQQQFINQVLDTAPNLIFVKNWDGSFVLVNQAMANLFGLPKEAVTRRSNAAVHDIKEETDAYLRDDRAVISSNAPVHHEEPFTMPDGEVRWYDTLKTPLRRMDGEVQVLAISSDITARKRAEEALRDSEARVRALLDAVPDHIVVLDAQGTCVESRADSIAEIPNVFANLSAKNPADVLPPDFARAMREAHGKVSSGQTLASFEQGIDVDGMRRDFEARCASLPGGGSMFLIRDITERKMMERLKDDFISVVSHELRTPLAAVIGSLKLLGSGLYGDLPPEARELVDIASSSSDRLVRLVNDILDIEKIEKGRLELALRNEHIMDLVSSALRESEALAHGAGVSLILAERAPEAMAYVDAHWISQVLGNLLSNAIKFSPRGAAVEIGVSLDDHVHIEVRDRGAGIPLSFRGRIFEKFAQADASSTREKGGTGLGLSICKAVLDRLGGRIEYHNREGGGSIFHVELPTNPA